jgi:general L-amino acid transport system substrate-binding protein
LAQEISYHRCMLSLTRLAATILALLVAGEAQAGQRLDAIKARGALVCGVGASSAGFSRRDWQGGWRGFDVDICRAVAAAIFGDAEKVQFKPIDTLPNFLADAGIDVVLRGLTWTFGREARGELRFGPIVMYDGETFLTKKSLNVRDAGGLSGKTICVSQDAEFVPNLRYYFRSHNLTLKAVVSEKRSEAEDAFFAGGCDAMTADASELAEAVIGKAPHPDDYLILADPITKEPLAPLMRKGDDQFFDVVRWAIFALINAEELGIESGNADRMRASDNPDVKKFFADAPAGTEGLAPHWSFTVVKTVGNYGEVYDRHLGANSPAKLARGLNRLWTKGGLMYAPPLR